VINRESVDAWLRDGCGRCERYKTPSCKVHRWTAILEPLRELVRSVGLCETLKWGSPCYTFDGPEGAHVAMIAVFNDSCTLVLLKGEALEDPEGALERVGPNTRLARRVAFRSLDELVARRAVVRSLLEQAVALERAGVVVRAAPADEPVPVELARLLDERPEVRRAFEALTPGRRRSHVLHVQGAKQSETRARRAEQCAERILAGRGFNEREDARPSPPRAGAEPAAGRTPRRRRPGPDPETT
jgi:uncharacterized protein YdeI (YjbR/CyaY-like superfamily)